MTLLGTTVLYGESALLQMLGPHYAHWLRGRETLETPSPLACQAGPIRSKRSSSLLTVAPSSP